MEVVVLTFSYPGEPPGIVVVIMYLTPEPWIHHTMIRQEVEPTLGRIRADRELGVISVPVTEAFGIVRRALAGVDAMPDPPISTDFACDRAFLTALLRRGAPD